MHRSEDSLILLARGLGLLRVVTNLLHSYDVVGNNLIVLVGADERENGWIGEALAEHAAISKSPLARGLSQVSTDMMSVGTRSEICRVSRKDRIAKWDKRKNVRTRGNLQYYV